MHASRGGPEAKRASCGRQRSRVALCFPEAFHAAPVMRCRLTMKDVMGQTRGEEACTTWARVGVLFQRPLSTNGQGYRGGQNSCRWVRAAVAQGTRLSMTRRRAEKDDAKLAARCLAVLKGARYLKHSVS